MDINKPLSDNVKAILREADTSIVKLVGESHHLLYQFLRVTAGKIARTDAFYIGFFCERDMMVFPYSFDGKEYYDPNKFKYNPEGLAAWIQHNKKPYWYGQDEGVLLRGGKRFGQLAKQSEDAISVPILEPNRKKGPQVIGILSMQSYEPQTFDGESMQALEWLARSLVVVLGREREDELRRRRLSTAENDVIEPMLRPDNIVNQMLDKMQSIRRKAEAINNLLSHSTEDLSDAVKALIEECHQRQTETIELFLHSTLMKDTPMSLLSEQEKKIVFLLAEGLSRSKEGYTNKEISERLVISDHTVKTHLRSIYKKLGVSGRTGVVALAKNYLT